MAIREWRIESPIPHDVRMEHDWISGRVKLTVDEQLVYERPFKAFDLGFRHQFSIDERTFVVTTIVGFFWMAYSLKQAESDETAASPVWIFQTGSKWIGDALLVGTAWFLVPVVTILVWAEVAATERARLTPKSNDMTLMEFAASMQPPQGLAVVDDDGSSKIVWVGETAMWSLPSGPACYVFDAKGRLVE